MRMLTAAVALALAVLVSIPCPAGAAESIGPLCLLIDTFRDSFELFATSSGGANVLLTGRNKASGGSVIGSGYVANGSFTFYLTSPLPNAPGFVFKGAIDIATQKGTGQCFIIDATSTVCGGGQPLEYFLGPCQ